MTVVILRHTDEDDRMKCTVTDNLGRGQSTFIINESGLYGLILSLKPSAAMWTMRTNGVTIRYPIGRRQKVIFINKGRTDSGLPW